MKTQRPARRPGAGGRLERLLNVPVAVVGLLFLGTLCLAAQDKKNSGAPESGKNQGSIGLVASKEASAEEVGLPLYPGARPHKDQGDDSPAVQLGMWAGSTGFKLVVLKLESNDPPEKVAAFYQKALAKYGRVLNCAGSTRATGTKDRTDSSNKLHCSEDRPEGGELILKAGTEAEQHIVGIRPSGGRSVFELVYVEARGSESGKSPRR